MRVKIKNFTKKISLFYIILYLLCMLALFLLVIPILWIVFSEKPQTIIEILKIEKVQLAILTTFFTATITSIISIFFGVSLGYIFSRKQFIGKNILITLVDLPLALPHSVAGIALLSVFGRYGLIGQIFPSEYGTIFTRSILGIIIAQLFVSAPILIQGARETFNLIDPDFEIFSHILGASSFTTFRKVVFPQARKSILASSILCWARAASEFGAVVFMAYYPLTAPVIVFDLYNSQGISAAKPVAVFIIIISTILFALARVGARIMKKEDR